MSTFLGATQSSTTDAFGTSNATPIPSGTSANSDVYLIVSMDTASPTVTPPAGFLEVAGSPFIVVGSNGTHCRVYWKRSSSGEGAGNYTVGFSLNVWSIITSFAVDGLVTTGNPHEDIQFSVTSGSTTVPNITVTTTVADDMLVFIGIGDQATGPMDWTPPTGPAAFTEVIDNDYDAIAWLVDSATGSRLVTGATTTASVHGQMVIALKSAGGGGGGGSAEDYATPWRQRPPGRISPAGRSWTPAPGISPEEPPTPISVAVDTATLTLTGQTPTAGSLPPFVTAVSGDSRYLVDQYGAGIVPQFDTMWSIIQQAGNTALNGGSATWQQDIDFWLTTRSGQGFNAVKVSLLGQTDNGAPNSDGRTFDSKWPFGATAAGTSYGDPSTGLASDYWTRMDYLIDQAAAAGVTVFIDVITPQDVTTGIGGVMCTAVGGSVKALAEFQALGTALGTRYSVKPNIVWFIGADYFDVEVTKIQALLTSLAAAGDNHLVTVENWASPGGHTWTTSRKTDAGVSMTLGPAVADFDSSYIYDQTYLSATLARATSPTLPVIWIDGYYEQAGDDSLALRRFTAWSLTYGQPGVQYGNEATWSTQSGWRTVTSSPSAELGHIIKIRQAVTGYARWPDLVPDTASAFITAGRGSGDTFVTGGKTADGALGVIYLPNAASAITVDTTQMVAGYSVTWVDPTNGATVSGVTGTSFSRGAANAAGGADWLLVLQGTATSGATVDPATLDLAGQTPAAAGSGATSVVADVATLTLAGVTPTAAGTGASTTTVDVAALTLTGVDLTAAGTGAASVAVDVATLTLSGQTPTAAGSGTADTTVDTAVMSLAGQTPTASGTGEASAAADTALLTLTVQDVTAATGGGPQSATVDPAALTLAGVDAAAGGTGAASLAVDPAALTLAGQTPTAAGTGAAAQAVDPAVLTLTGIDITAAGTGAAAQTVDVAVLVLSGVEISAGGSIIQAVDTAALTLGGVNLTASGTGAAAVTVDIANLTLVGITPAAFGTGAAAVIADAAILTLTGVTPTAAGTGGTTSLVDAAVLTLTGVEIVPAALIPDPNPIRLTIRDHGHTTTVKAARSRLTQRSSARATAREHT